MFGGAVGHVCRIAARLTARGGRGPRRAWTLGRALCGCLLSSIHRVGARRTGHRSPRKEWRLWPDRAPPSRWVRGRAAYGWVGRDEVLPQTTLLCPTREERE